ncbi:nuclease-related domain-containing DEAD/DEAH box helicase [Deinococcus marmoris]
MADFVATEQMAQPGQEAEARVWEAVRNVWRLREGLVYWRYPVFTAKAVREPDLLIADPDLGLTIIEVKSFQLRDITGIQGHTWFLTDRERPTVMPYEQARHQAQALLDRLSLEPVLHQAVNVRVLVALPNIRRAEWEARGLHRLASTPPCLFAEDFRGNGLLERIRTAPSLVQAPALSADHWRVLKAFLGTPGALRSSARIQPPHRAVQRRADVLKFVRAHLHEFDLQQELIAKVIPPGPQRIRGVAGSGKTVLLAQKAALMHLRHPEWRIALVFWSRALYDAVRGHVDHWLQYFSGGERTLASAAPQLTVMHAWGAKNQPGFYRMVAEAHHLKPQAVNVTQRHSPMEALALACCDLLVALETTGGVIPQFDAVLIDEGQDLLADGAAFMYGDKQAFFWLALQTVRPDAQTGGRRLIWAYDEAQSLDSLTVPTAAALFGADHSHLVQGVHPGGAKKSEVMTRCYRTPNAILTAAHALGMGLLREDGMLTGLTQRAGWKALGYEVEGSFVSGQQVTLHRPAQNAPNPVAQLWKDDLLSFEIYPTRQEELQALTRALHQNLTIDGLFPSRQLLVVVLGATRRTKALIHEVALYLRGAGLDFYVPGQQRANELRDLAWYDRCPDQFWVEGAITVTDARRAKGNEADMVQVVGFDALAAREDDIFLRNQLFVGLTRSRGWVRLSGAGCAASKMTLETRRVLNAGGTFTFQFRPPSKRDLGELEPPPPEGSWWTDWTGRPQSRGSKRSS